MRRISTVHIAIAFLIPFLTLLPIVVLLAQKRRWHKYALLFHRLWARSFFALLFVPIQIEWRYKPEKGHQYIFCANHFSYFDIPAMILMNVPFKFMGKSSLGKVPLFGYMYSLLHIMVDRSDPKSRVKSQRRVMEEIEAGFNITYFPEGGMMTKNPPKMVAFKNGAFKMAVDKDIPIVPVTLATNYKLFPDDPRLFFYWGKLKMIVHPPISQNIFDSNQVSELKMAVRKAIESGFN